MRNGKVENAWQHCFPSPSSCVDFNFHSKCQAWKSTQNSVLPPNFWFNSNLNVHFDCGTMACGKRHPGSVACNVSKGDCIVESVNAHKQPLPWGLLKNPTSIKELVAHVNKCLVNYLKGKNRFLVVQTKMEIWGMAWKFHTASVITKTRASLKDAVNSVKRSVSSSHCTQTVHILLPHLVHHSILQSQGVE